MNHRKFTRAVLMAIVLATLLLAQFAVAMEAGDFKAALAQAIEEDKPLIIDFYTDW